MLGFTFRNNDPYLTFCYPRRFFYSSGSCFNALSVAAGDRGRAAESEQLHSGPGGGAGRLQGAERALE